MRSAICRYGSPHDGVNGSRSSGQCRGLRSAPSPTATRWPSNRLAASISPSSVTTSSPCAFAVGAAVLRPFQGRRDDRGEIGAREVLRDDLGLAFPERGEAVAGQAPVEHLLRVVHLAVAEEVDDGAAPGHHHGRTALAAAWAAAGSAASMTANASSSSAAETNHASNALGGG